MNVVNIIGRLTKDVEFRATQGGNGIASFTVAVDKGLSQQKKNEYIAQGKRTADFINCKAFNKTGEIIGQYFEKGGLIGITGKWNTGSYVNKEGVTIYTNDLLVDNFYFLSDNGNSNNQNNNQRYNNQNNNQNNNQRYNNQNNSQDYGIDNFSEMNDDIPF